MVFSEVIDRLAKRGPLPTMARAALEHALQAESLDELFERVADRQYTRKLLFSSVAELMSLVVCSRMSMRGAFLRSQASIGASLQAVYDKVDALEPEVSRALVRHVANACPR